MDFFKGKQSEGENSQHPDKYQPATPIVPLHGGQPKPATMREYQRASNRKLDQPELGRRATRRDIYEDESDGPSILTNILHLFLWPLRLGCRGCGCLILFVLIGSCVLITYAVLAKPPFLWNPITSVINGDAPARVEQLDNKPTLTYSVATQQIVDQTTQFKIGANNLTITQAQFQAIARQLFGETNIKNVYTVISDNEIELLWNFAQDPDQQVWFVARLGLEGNNQLKVKHIGFNNLGLPSFLNDALTNATLSSLNLNKDAEVDDVLTKLLNLPDTAQITNIQLKDERVDVEVLLTSGLDNLFN